MGLRKCSGHNNDPKDFAFDEYFDIIVVDAPCSGSGLVSARA
jgi:16S rRNA C967 or C1407 C5-methylase (RsmB/RsmF family)